MSFSLSRLLAPDTASLDHLSALAAGLGDAVNRVAQLMGATGETAAQIEKDLADVDAQASALHMALLTSLRSSFITPLPRQDLYLLADGLNHATERICNLGVLIILTEQYRLPAPAMDILENLGRQAELLEESTTQLRDLDALEETWIQLQRNSKRGERLLTEWLSGMTEGALHRTYNRQRETAHAVSEAVATVRQLTVHLGTVLVRES